MRSKKSVTGILMLVLLSLFWAVACQSTAGPEVTVEIPSEETTTVTVPTPTLEVPTVAPTETTQPTPTETAAPTEPPATPTEAATATSEPTPAVQAAGPLRVAYVASEDVLNVRSEPGADAEIVGTLEPGSSNVTVTGSGQMVEDDLWVPIEGPQGLTGWVNSLYLIEEVDPATFCQEEAPRQLLDKLRTAIESRDPAQLEQLVAEGRGLRVRTYWWNPEVRFTGDALDNTFAGGQSYHWGVQDGSGFDITGTFAEVIVPDLESDFLGASETACNEILHGSTTGLIQVPEEYEGINFYSVYRPAPPDVIEFDWGSWVVGMEQWQGQYYISFLIHFQYEV